jgi:Antibiotic biosynthesis monooxygenase
MTVVPGKREEMIRILRESSADIPGCFSYVVAQDSANENFIWVTEMWDSSIKQSRCIFIVAGREKRNTSGQSDRFELRKDRGLCSR